MFEGMLTLPEHLSPPPVFSRVCVSRCFAFYLVFNRTLFVILSFCFLPLYCPSFFDLRFVTTALVSSNFLKIYKKVMTLLTFA
jgi:hypothetical protein